MVEKLEKEREISRGKTLQRLEKQLSDLEKENPDYLLELIQNANKIKKILK